MSRAATGITCERCEDETQWRQFVAASPQGSRYCQHDIITALGCEADYWLLQRNGHPVAGIPVITRNAAGPGLPIHSYYVGMMLHPEAWRGKANRRTENLLAISAGAMHRLCAHYDGFQLSLHPELDDVRGFDWFNYHQPERGRIRIQPRYTAQVTLHHDTLFDAARSSRRREFHYARDRERLEFHTDGKPDELISLWQASLQRQGQTLPTIECELTRRFAEHLLQQQNGIIGVTRNRDGEATSAGLLMLDYHGLAHLPVVGTGNTRYGGTLLYFSLMQWALHQGCTLLDFNGANSPQRAYFKHSIGGKARLYFHLGWQRPA